MYKRQTQNFDMLKELGKTDKPILLKRGLAGTIKELLMSAEYIMAGGNENVILCERGIRTFETATRNTLDLSAVTVLHEMCIRDRAYIDSVKANLEGQLNNTWLQKPDGSRVKLEKRKD